MKYLIIKTGDGNKAKTKKTKAIIALPCADLWHFITFL